ncbi:MAG: nucleoside deaminase [Flavobacteriales bacterium]|jgi:tRNA(adenine34) deaminase|nr:nucleoside deaminase [Flavobacteriales bacterium]
MELFSDEYFMNEALKEAKKAFEAGEVPIGAVIVAQDTIIAKAHNQTERLNDFTAHAEMLAFTAASDYLGGKYLNECTLYVTLEPCVMCCGASYHTKIGKIVIGASDPKRGAYSKDPQLFHPKSDIQVGVMAKECQELLQSFFANKRG